MDHERSLKTDVATTDAGGHAYHHSSHPSLPQPPVLSCPAFPRHIARLGGGLPTPLEKVLYSSLVVPALTTHRDPRLEDCTCGVWVRLITTDGGEPFRMVTKPALGRGVTPNPAQCLANNTSPNQTTPPTSTILLTLLILLTHRILQLLLLTSCLLLLLPIFLPLIIFVRLVHYLLELAKPVLDPVEHVVNSAVDLLARAVVMAVFSPAWGPIRLALLPSRSLAPPPSLPQSSQSSPRSSLTSKGIDSHFHDTHCDWIHISTEHR
ncbi:hypothetical protein FPV67DRAFT_1670510 [Lyophyllum atratum]|nr:hypothetical protein FPV67DRAFT_1670510 [Lyophyllum atratum]